MKNKLGKEILKFLVFPLIAVLILWLLPVGTVFGEGTKGSDLRELEVAVENAGKILEEAKGALNTANKVLADAQAKADEANKILSEAESSLQQTEARLADANAKVVEAKAALEGASEGDDIKVLKANLFAAAQQELESAQNAYNDAVAALEVAKANLEQAQQELEQAKLAVDEATNNLEAAQKTYDDAVAALEKTKKNSKDEKGQDNNQGNDENSDQESGNNENPGSNGDLTLLGTNNNASLLGGLEINPTIKTVKNDYSPGETVIISGDGFYPDTKYTIRVTRPNGAKDSALVTSDNIGSFIYNYQLDGITGEYLVEAIDSNSSIIASTTFTDTTGSTGIRLDWGGQGSKYADLSTCTQAYWHCILTPGGNNIITSAKLYVTYNNSPSTETVGYPSSPSGRGAWHFDVYREGGKVISAYVIYSYTSGTGKESGFDKFVLTISHSNCIIPETGIITLNKTYVGASATASFYLKSGSKYYKIDGSSTYNKNNAKVTLNGEGTIIWYNLPVPKTYVIEEDIPSGYSSVIDLNNFELKAGDNKIVNVTNTKLGKIKIIKSGLKWGLLLPWSDKAIFILEGPGVSKTETLSNAPWGSSSVTWSNLPPGTYTLNEEYHDGNNYSYFSNINFPHTFEITGFETDTITFYVENTPIINSITLNKTYGGPTTTAYFYLKSGSTYYNQSGIPVSKDDAKVTLVGEGTIVWYNLPVWKTYVIEEEPIPGYTSSINPVSVYLRCGVHKTFNVVNTLITGSIKLTKSGLAEDITAGFTLYDSGGHSLGYKEITGVASGEPNPYATWGNVPYGSGYYIEETKVPSGYNKMANITGISITSQGQVVSVSGENTIIIGSITVTKKDATDGSLLAGSTFSLLKADGVTPATDAYGNPIPNQVSDANGKAYFTNLVFGTYVVKEIGAPTGYGFADPVNVEIGGDSGADVAIEIRDPRIPGSVTIKKINSSTGATMSGIGFTIYYKSSGNPVYPEAFTNDSGLVTFTGLSWDTYTIVETTPPSGYTPASPVDVTITKDNALAGVYITLSNTPVPPPPLPSPPTTPPTIAVAGITTGGGIIEVAGLAFTGVDIRYYIGGFVLILAGLVLSVIFMRKSQKRKGNEVN